MGPGLVHLGTRGFSAPRDPRGSPHALGLCLGPGLQGVRVKRLERGAEMEPEALSSLPWGQGPVLDISEAPDCPL